MALTLLEAAKRNSGDVFRASVIETFARSHDILGALPFEDVAGNAVKFNQEGTLPTVAFRAVNEGYTAAEGKLDPVTEPLLIVGGDLDVDRFIDKTMPGNREAQEAMKIKRLGQDVAHKFIKGDSNVTIKEPDGLQVRIPVGNAQAVSMGTAALSLQTLDQAIDGCDDPTHLIMNQQMRRRITTYLRTNSGGINYIVDDFGTQVAVYNGLRILEVDRANMVNASLDFNEPTSTTSIYVVSFREGMLTGIQNGDMDARDLGELDTAPVFRTRVEWYVGWAIWHKRAAVRLLAITDAAVVA